MSDMQQISYNGHAAAMAGREQFWLVDEIADLEPEDPVRVWVSWLCLYARDVLTGLQPGPYDQPRAERFAREALMEDEEFIAIADQPADGIAEHFGVPAEQVPKRFVDLAHRLIEDSTA